MIGLMLAATSALAAPPAAPTYQELMDPAVFPEPQRGMVVESVDRRPEGIRVLTTGADIRILLATGEVRLSQRIGHRRELVALKTDTPWTGVRVTHSGAGFARITVEKPSLTIRVNGDSLLMLHAHEPVSARVESRIEPAWESSHEVHHLIADEWGAFGIYCSDTSIDDGYDPYGDSVAFYPLPADEVLWLAVCPPKEYDWDRSFTDNVVWHWSNVLGYPPDDALQSWQEHGNTVLLQSEVMLWKDWNLDFVPRLGDAEFARVRQTIRDLGMRFIVYTSPYYFIKGTPNEGQAMNSFENFTTWPPGDASGRNMELFMSAIERVMEQHKPDGLYFDGQYTANPAALYALARRTRKLIGEDGILEWHSTGALGSRDCYLPQADAYVDFILRGEGRGGRYDDDDYLRYFVSGYNIHNSIGVLCNNSAEGRPTLDQCERLLGVNGRYHTIGGWVNRPEIMEIINGSYKPRLNADLRRHVDAGCDARQIEVAAKVREVRSEMLALASPPEWDAPVMSLEFDRIPDGERLISPANADPFAIADGVLRVSGKPHTHAYIRAPLAGKVSGFEARLRLGTDVGQSWGPGVCIEVGERSRVRLGLRSKGEAQLDVLGGQHVLGRHKTHLPGEWTHLRARWSKRLGVVEISEDGQVWQRLRTFEHGGALNADAVVVMFGKVPYGGDPIDHSTEGEDGTSEIDWIRVYGE